MNLLVLLLSVGHEPLENKKEKNNFLIPKVKNCLGTSSFHRSKNTACMETQLFTVTKGYM